MNLSSKHQEINDLVRGHCHKNLLYCFKAQVFGVVKSQETSDPLRLRKSRRLARNKSKIHRNEHPKSQEQKRNVSQVTWGWFSWCVSEKKTTQLGTTEWPWAPASLIGPRLAWWGCHFLGAMWGHLWIWRLVFDLEMNRSRWMVGWWNLRRCKLLGGVGEGGWRHRSWQVAGPFRLVRLSSILSRIHK